MAGRPFTDWQAYYESYDLPSLMAEGATFPATVAVNQLAAYLVRLIDVACDDPGVSDNDRIKAARLAGSAEDTLRNALAAQDAAALQRFEQALSATFDRVSRFGLYPEVATIIVSGTFSTTRRQGPR